MEQVKYETNPKNLKKQKEKKKDKGQRLILTYLQRSQNSSFMFKHLFNKKKVP